ncbi:hypothetical protein [Lysinibacillus endophyticus]|uniref:hypothetical protein n=1 Tax=Ureibacillus endophyticus TaxID=1978490 RepID=UPI00209DB38C|nr:hypothetical protein [Lysinibacillus endophyticus]MCP1145071.1 hypothetical protein [Lysinibacillus endophyticus]
MKNGILIGVVIVGILVIFFFGDFSSKNHEEQEFLAFQQFLNDEFFPISNDCFDHLNQAVDELYAFTFSDWYFNGDGRDENGILQSDLEQIEDDVLLYEIKYNQALALKKNILNQIESLKETLQLLSNAPSEEDEKSFERFRLKLITMIEILSTEMDEMNKLLESNQ